MLWSALSQPFVKIDEKKQLVSCDITGLAKMASGSGTDRVDLGPGRNMRTVFFNLLPPELSLPLYTPKAERSFQVPDAIRQEKPKICFNSRCPNHAVTEAKAVKDWLKCPKCTVAHFCSNKCRSNTFSIHKEQCVPFNFDSASIYCRMLNAVEANLEGNPERAGTLPSDKFFDNETSSLCWPMPISMTNVLEPLEVAALVQRLVVNSRKTEEWLEAMRPCQAVNDVRCFICGKVSKFEVMICGAQIFGVTPANAVVGWAFVACSAACASEPSPTNPFVPHISFEAGVTAVKNNKGIGYATTLGARFEPGLLGSMIFADDVHKMTTAMKKL